MTTQQLLDDARQRLTVSRLGKSIMREMDADILIIRRLVDALEAYTPTGDGREALADDLARRMIDDPKRLMLAEGTGALHVALSETIRATIEDVYADCGDSDPGVLSTNIARRLAGDLPPAILATAGFRRSEVPEPSAVRGKSRGRHTDAQMLYMICLALEEGLDGVNHVDIPDLIIKMISEHWGTADADTSPDSAEAALAQLAPYIPDHLLTSDPQGEPSDAEVHAAAVALDPSAWEPGPNHSSQTFTRARDASLNLARAALRAAAAVREEGR